MVCLTKKLCRRFPQANANSGSAIGVAVNIIGLAWALLCNLYIRISKWMRNIALNKFEYSKHIKLSQYVCVTSPLRSAAASKRLFAVRAAGNGGIIKQQCQRIYLFLTRLEAKNYCFMEHFEDTFLWTRLAVSWNCRLIHCKVVRQWNWEANMCSAGPIQCHGYGCGCWSGNGTFSPVHYEENWKRNYLSLTGTTEIYC